MKVFCKTKIDVLLHRFCKAFGESKDILMTNRKRGMQEERIHTDFKGN